MKNTLRATYTWLHTWVGLLLGWLLYAIFVTGTATYYRGEITQWMKPELRQPSSAAAAMVDLAVTEIRRVSPDATGMYIVLPDARTPGLFLNWEDAKGRHSKTVDAETAKIEARDSRAGEFFYRFHFQLQLPYPWGRWIACLAAMFMLVALITGIIAHRQFFKDFFTFRPGKGGTRSWLDFHNLTGVIALPFYFMISYTALIMFLHMLTPLPRWAITPPTPVAEASQNVGPTNESTAEDSSTAPLPTAPWGPMVAEVEKEWGAGSLRYIYAPDLGTPEGRVNFSPGTRSEISVGGRNSIVFNAVTGERIKEDSLPRGFVSKLHDVLYGLHLANFAGPVLRLMFFFFGLLGTALVATGLIMWSVKRRKRQESLHGPGRAGFGHALVERLNITTIVGFPLSLATIFWANRLLPLGLEARGDREVNVVFVVWGLALLHACLRPAWKAWREQLLVASLLFSLLPFLDALTTPGASTRSGFNLAMLAFGGLFAWAFLRASTHRRSRDDSGNHGGARDKTETTPEATT